MGFWTGRWRRSFDAKGLAAKDQMLKHSSSAKERLVNSIFAAAATDRVLGHLVLKDLPERYFRQLIDEHNATVEKYLNQIPIDWWDFRQQVQKLLIPTYADFQRQLADTDQKQDVDPQYCVFR